MTILLRYLPLITIGILTVTAVGITLLHYISPRFRFTWLLAALGSLLALPAVILMRPDAARWLPLANWQNLEIFNGSPALLIDPVSWSFSLALVSLALAVILTDVARAAEFEWSAWAACLGLAAIGVTAVMAGNPVTMMLLWVAVDITELIILLWHLPESQARENVVAAFAARTGGVFLLWLAMIVAARDGIDLQFDQIPENVVALLILAAGLRLGVIPVHLPGMHERSIRRGLGTMLRLVPASTSLVLLTRTAAAGLPVGQSLLFVVLAALAAYAASLLWIFSRDELEGRPFWILGMASLSLAAAVRGQPAASLSWGLALLFSGGLIFLTTARHVRLMPILFLGLLGISALPYTAAWQAARLYGEPIQWAMFLFLIPHALLMGGYARHILRAGTPIGQAERWVWLVYPAGLLVLPVIQNFTAWMSLEAGAWSLNSWGWTTLFPTVISVGLAVLWWVRLRKEPATGSERAEPGLMRSMLGMSWLYRALWWVFRIGSRAIDILSGVLEGEAGLLWAMLLLTLLVALIVQGGGGGL